MSNQSNLVDSLKKISEIIVLLIGIISTVSGFVLSIREDRNLYGFLILLAGLVIVLASLSYVVFSKYPPQFEGGSKGGYRFYKSRIYAILSIGIILGFLLAFAFPNLRYLSSDSQIKSPPM